ncbi:MAG: hypothetical protein E4H00_04220 [Myxococcales bacterium]|nr:MAG: hypothetical protein E4H00_04220 [Myxococcales bacterium]
MKARKIAVVGSRWWVAMKDEVSHEPDALVEVTGHRVTPKGKIRVLVRYVNLKTHSGGEITGTFKLKHLIRKGWT